MEGQFTINSIIFIVLLIVPGIFFKRFYFQGEFTKQFGSGLFADRLITSIFWGLFIQLITFLIYSQAFGLSFDTIRPSLNTAYTELAENSIPQFSSGNLWLALGYIISSIVLAILSGNLCHKIIRGLRIDVKYRVFRFSNEWFYYFRGDILRSNDFKRLNRGKVLSTLVDIVLDTGDGKTKIFTGFLSQYNVNKNGELDTIYLTEPKRFSETTRQFKEIPGDCLVIPYNRVVDMNLRYNVKVVNSTNKKALISNIISLVGLVGFMFLLIYPWFLDADIFDTIIGICCSIFAWLLMIAIALEPVQPEGKRKLNRQAILASAFFIISLTFASLYLLGVFSS